jgi:hypothetical protein
VRHPSRRSCGGWFLGKDYIGWLYAIYRTMFCGKPGTTLYIFPEAQMGRRILWQNKDMNGKSMLSYIPGYEEYERTGRPNDFVRAASSQDMTLTLRHQPTGENCYIAIRQADPDTLVGANFKMFLISEYAIPGFNPNVLPYSVVPTMESNPDCQTLILTTWRGENHATKTWDAWNEMDSPDYFCDFRTLADGARPDGTPVMTLESVQNQVKAGNISLGTFQQEFLMSREAATEDAYYRMQLDQLYESERISPTIIANPLLPVFTAWDVGGMGKTPGERTAVWFFQKHPNGEVVFIDFMDFKNQALYQSITKVQARCAEMGYRHVVAVVPHDMKHTETTGTTKGRHFKTAGIKTHTLTKTSSVVADIEKVRPQILSCRFNEKYCKEGLKALKAYCPKPSNNFDEKGNAELGKPNHNWASHAADAFRYAILSIPYLSRYTESVLHRPRPTGDVTWAYRY